jgi:ABC-type glycerol-3-phosphate transport system permease component
MTDNIAVIITYLVFALFAFTCAYPFYYIIINTISANNLSEKGAIVFIPLGIHFQNYLDAMRIPGLLDTAKISVARTLLGVLVTVATAAFLGYMFTCETL